MCKSKHKGGLGFKDLRIFNIVLLAKQSLRVLQNTDSLPHQVLKAKYFPRTGFMQSKLGHASSYTWQGIWEGKKILEKGRY